MGAVQADHAQRRQQLRHRPRVASRDRRLRLVVALQPVERGLAELGIREVGRESVERRPHVRPERLPVHRGQRSLRRPRWERRSHHGSIGADPGGLTRFGVVVVVTGQPEHRHHGPRPLPLEYPRQPRGGERLVNRVQGAGKKPGLLPGGDGQRARTLQPGDSRLQRRGCDERLRQIGIERVGSGARAPQRPIDNRGRDETKRHAA